MIKIILKSSKEMNSVLRSTKLSQVILRELKSLSKFRFAQLKLAILFLGQNVHGRNICDRNFHGRKVRAQVQTDG